MLMRRLFLGPPLPHNLPPAAFHFLVGSFGASVGLLTNQATLLIAGSIFLFWMAYYGLPERLQRTRIALRALSLVAALATVGLALTSFRDYSWHF